MQCWDLLEANEQKWRIQHCTGGVGPYVNILNAKCPNSFDDDCRTKMAKWLWNVFLFYHVENWGHTCDTHYSNNIIFIKKWICNSWGECKTIVNLCILNNRENKLCFVVCFVILVLSVFGNFRSKTRVKTVVHDLEEGDGSFAHRGDEEKADILNQFFASVFTKEDVSEIYQVQNLRWTVHWQIFSFQKK